MDMRSVTRPACPSIRSVVAGAHLCDQVAGLLMIEAKVARQAFLGEPVEEVLAMAKWALKHEGEAGFEAEEILPAWAQKRTRGYWRIEDRRVEECRHCHGSGWCPVPSRMPRNGKRSARVSSAQAARALALLSKPFNWLLSARGAPDGENFPLGQVVATPGALKLLEEAGEDPCLLLSRHRSGDWGELDTQDRRENELSLKHGWRLLSSYPVGDEKVWIITEADRSYTTILLPNEY